MPNFLCGNDVGMNQLIIYCVLNMEMQLILQMMSDLVLRRRRGQEVLLSVKELR